MSAAGGIGLRVHGSLACLLALAPLLASCGGGRVSRDDGAPPPFVFRSLDLRQQDLLGRPTWRLSSPEARYDIRRRVAQADRPQGVIFQDGKAAYRLSALSGTVINDGQVVLLEGAIRVEQLGDRPMLIEAERARWLPGRNRLEIDRRPRAQDGANRLSARRARFFFDTSLLRLVGEPLLEHWSGRFDPLRPSARGPAEVVLHASQADWFPKNGALRASGPIRGVRRVGKRPPGQPPQTLTAASLEGSTVGQEYWLRAPVRFDDPVEAASLQAQDVRIDMRERQARSDSPFQARRGSLQVSGQRFEVNEAEQQVSVPAGCLLVQAGDSLRADACSWNWDNQEVQAEGAVELRRQANRQRSRGDRLSGRLGPQGELTLSRSGGRVVSRFQVPRRSAPRPAGPPPPGPEPIRL